MNDLMLLANVLGTLIGMLGQHGVLTAEDMAYFMGMFDGIIKDREGADDE